MIKYKHTLELSLFDPLFDTPRLGTFFIKFWETTDLLFDDDEKLDTFYRILKCKYCDYHNQIIHINVIIKYKKLDRYLILIFRS